MGVPGLKTWMQGELPRAWEPAGRAVPPEGADHVYVDLNGALHQALQRARPRTRRKMRRQVEIWLSRMIRASRPRRTLFLAIDGPAPLAKLLHQRASRKSEARRLVRASGQGQEAEVSRLELTVGTELMAEVDSWVSAWAQEQLQGQWGHLRIVVSGCAVPGEGETKIVEELAANIGDREGDRGERAAGQASAGRVGQAGSPAAGGTGRRGVGGEPALHLVWSADSDMCLMAVQQPHRPERVADILVMLEMPDPSGADAGRGSCFSTAGFHRHFTAQRPAFDSPRERREWLQQLSLDFLVLCVMGMGNDYLPAVTGCRFQPMWEAYEKLKGGARVDAALLASDGTLDQDLLREISPAQPRKSKKGGGGGADSGAQTHRAPPDALAYVSSLRWLSAMYLSGVCVDYRWAYDGASPELEAILSDEAARGGDGMWSTGGRGQKPLPPLAIALSLIPPSHKELVLEPVQKLMDPDSPIGELFEVCEDCERLRGALGEATTAYTATTASHKEAQAEVEEALARIGGGQGAPPGAPEEALRRLEIKCEKAAGLKGTAEGLEVARRGRVALEAMQAARARVSESHAAFREHNARMHPYEPFPVDLLERHVQDAVQGSWEKLTRAERRMASFGRPLALEVSERYRPAAPSEAQHSQRHRQRKSGGGRRPGRGGGAARSRPAPRKKASARAGSGRPRTGRGPPPPRSAVGWGGGGGVFGGARATARVGC